MDSGHRARTVIRVQRPQQRDEVSNQTGENAAPAAAVEAVVPSSSREKETPAAIGRSQATVFSPLLPVLGDVSQLPLFQAKLTARFKQLESDRESGHIEDPSQVRERSSEDAMLQQVLQWLSIGSS